VVEADFALLLNTTHPAIRSVLEEKFDEAMSRCARGDKFCIEVFIGFFSTKIIRFTYIYLFVIY
jgi:hypothetical protein